MRYAAIVLSLCFVCSAVADEQRDPVPVVLSSPDGQCYARSVPSDSRGRGAATTTFDVTERGDALRDTYKWYSFRLYPWCWVYLKGGDRQIGVVRIGKWAGGHAAKKEDVAISFFVGGRLVREYSTLDIAGRPDNVRGSVSHYVVFSDIEGFVDPSRHPTPFQATTIDGRKLEFDPKTGEELSGRLRGAAN